MIALFAALGLGTKQIIRPIIEPVTIALVIPGGALIGGFYMLWLVLTKSFIPKFGSGTLFGIVQAIVVIILPFGSHGIFTFLTYPLPGLAIDLIDLFFVKRNHVIVICVLEGALANVVGTTAVSLFLFSLPLEIFLFILLLAIFSGNLGGILAFLILKQVKNPVLRATLFPNEMKEQKGNQEELASK